MPFLILLLGAATEFGSFLHRRQLLWSVARTGALALGRTNAAPSAEDVNRVRRVMLECGGSLRLRPQDVTVVPGQAPRGFYRVIVRSPHQGFLPFDWLSDMVAVQLLVPVEG